MEAAFEPKKTMHIFDHLRELRKRLVISLVAFAVFTILAFTIYDHIVTLFTQFYTNLSDTDTSGLYVTSIIEGMTTKLKISAIAGLTLSAPLHLYNLIAFVFPALEKKEKRWVSVALVASFLLIVLSTYLSYFKILPISINFLTDDGFIPSDVGLLLNYNTNLFYAMYFVFWSMIAFQLPILFVVLMAMGLIKRKKALKASRFVIVVIFVLASIVTPPDVVSQIGLGLPLVILYYLSILFAKIFGIGGEEACSD